MEAHRTGVKVANIVGTRPEFIQVEPVFRELARRHTPILVHTGQHYDRTMSESILSSLKLSRPQYDLGVGSGSHALQTAQTLERLEPVLDKEQPDCVLVYGDTNSTLAGALTAAKMEIPVAHVEAGMRSYDRRMPEELNRIVVDHLSNLLFCPTRTSAQNLRKEGLRKGIRFVGDVMFDSALRWARVARRLNVAGKLGLPPKPYLLMTLHRPSNVDNPRFLQRILRVVARIDRPVVFPIHPRTKVSFRKTRTFERPPPNLKIVDPLDYTEFLSLLMESEMVLTDSGGVQKQAYFFGVPCVTLRRETEWTETVAEGWNAIVGTSSRSILAAVRNFRPRGRRPKVFGDGHASSRIVRALEERF